MKLTVLFLIITCLQVSATVKAQKITLSEKNSSLKKVFNKIETQSGYYFWYENEILIGTSPVDINLKNATLKETLEATLKGQNLTFSIVDKTIVLERKKVVAAVSREIKGTVSDTTGYLPGVSIVVKGKPGIGTTSDVNGQYILDVPDEEDVLVFSRVGFISQEVSVKGKSTIDVTLKASDNILDDVVVVAFGTQKRTDMIGSVTSIKPSDLKVPSSNLTTALAGRAAGVIAYQRSGEPGADNADFFVRGVTTFGYKTTPLILIDGIELSTTDLARLQPDDIASFSIMKDATSTALYGARGANGVILVTTKQGAVGRASLSLRLENSISAPTQNIELADPITYMKMANESILTRDPLGQTLYSDDKIENTVNGANPYIYPANDWREIMFKDYTNNQRVNLNVSGGGGVARYFVSGSFNRDNGIMKVDRRNNFNNNIDLKSYSLRSNITIDLTKTTEMLVRLSGTFDDYVGPIDGGADMYRKVMRSNPVLFPAYYPMDDDHQYVKHIMFGNFRKGDVAGYINPYADMTKGYKDYQRSLMLAQLELKQDLKAFTEGLSFRVMMNTNRSSYFGISRFYNPFFYELSAYDRIADQYSIKPINENTATEYLGYREDNRDISSVFYMESMLNYNRTFGNKHNLSGLLVYIMRSNSNANAADLQLSLPFRNLGLSGRTTYAYDNRYFAEFNFGYNGSERFHESKRFGFFPSFGVAWSVSNEKFFEPLKNTFTNLRLRATYGLIGNDAIGSPQDRFFYLSNVNMNNEDRAAIFGNGVTNHRLPGVSLSRYANSDITWETAAKRNIALELGLFNKVNIIAEYFEEYRKNILMTRASIPTTMGFAAPIMANVGEASGRGVDASVDYSHSFANGLWLSARGNFTYATGRYEVYEEPQYLESYRYRAGQQISQQYGYIAERLFTDDAEAENSPKQNFGEYGGGDIKYLDVNSDGQITSADMVPIGNPTTPQIVYGFGFSAGFKGFDASAFFQGLANESFWIDAAATSPFNNETQVMQAYADSYWSEDKRDIYALWPRLSPNINNNNNQRSTWFMRDGSFLRLKQVEVGYTLPEKWSTRLYMSNLRIYVNGTNLLNLSSFDLWDPEMGGNGLGYPLQRVFNFGLNMKF
ncbi:TonB-dependent receptor [Sphingobacterium pedocola]|uniref:SusC/RagA family TonB-linked outer membrane protein n=1 Tax=Sphingobacterium pedocola TaxID=2082722 RepID=A0ABR9T7C5_9SPHI|nr:TonB-dependent receptor [Sphingobacterium pedocola]MBE8721236.1 SusC/RagA family TonB-linked outer membrane protein [Sphingobacterium pedocola]